MPEVLRDSPIQGVLETKIRPLGARIGASLTHKLNMPQLHYGESDSKFTGSDLVNWSMDAWWLKNGAEKVLPPYHQGEEFHQENSGNLLIAYFPLSDFKDVLEHYRKNRGKSRVLFIKESLRRGINKVRDALSGGESIEMTVDPVLGVSFSTGESDYSEAESDYKDNKMQVRDLSRRMKLAKKLGMTHIIIQYGYDTAEGEKSDRSKLEIVIVGNQQNTEDLMGINPKTVGHVLTQLFSPGRNGITYEATGLSLDADKFYSLDKYKSGEYNPFQNATQLKLFDYRSKQ